MTNKPKAAAAEAVAWPDYLMIRDTGLHDDMGGVGQRIYTTAGAGYKKEKYVRASALDALRGEVAELKQSLDRLSGMKFSDRMHAALVSRADAAERRVADLTSLLSDTAGNLRRMANDEFADCDQVRLEHVVNRIDAALTKE